MEIAVSTISNEVHTISIGRILKKISSECVNFFVIFPGDAVLESHQRKSIWESKSNLLNYFIEIKQIVKQPCKHIFKKTQVLQHWNLEESV